jgi:hypothetical protein
LSLPKQLQGNDRIHSEVFETILHSLIEERLLDRVCLEPLHLVVGADDGAEVGRYAKLFAGPNVGERVGVCAVVVGLLVVKGLQLVQDDMEV